MSIRKEAQKKRPNSKFEFFVKLPRGYSPSDALSFHGRDKDAVSEVVNGLHLQKAVMLNDLPTLFDIDFGRTKNQAVCEVNIDGKMFPDAQPQAINIVQGLLGLRLNPNDFAKFIAADPVFGPLTKQQKNLRVIQSASVFEALTWAVMGQQINVSFAVSLRRTFIKLAGQQHSSGLYCYPSAIIATQIPTEELTSRQFSLSKAETILRLARLIVDEELDLMIGPENPLTLICQSLLNVKGIGPWTVNYALLRGYGHADCSLHGDVAIRSAIGKLWGHKERPGIAATEKFLNQFSPHRTMAAAHLWASLNTSSNY